jgi:hypothetical protein
MFEQGASSQRQHQNQQQADKSHSPHFHFSFLLLALLGQRKDRIAELRPSCTGQRPVRV